MIFTINAEEQIMVEYKGNNKLVANHNYPEVDVTDVKSKYMLLDFEDIIFKSPGDTDILQSRKDYGSEEVMTSLMDTIKAKGILEPPVVILTDDGKKARIVEGNRRMEAIRRLKKLGIISTDTGKALCKIKCEVRPSVMQVTEDIFQAWLSLNPSSTADEQEKCRAWISNQVMLQLGQEALIRNTQRMNWSVAEVAVQIKQQLDAGVDIEVLSKQFGLAVSTIKAKLSTLERMQDKPELLKAVLEKKTSWSVGEILNNVKDDEARKEILEKATSDEDKLSADEVKDLIDEKHEESIKSGGEGIKLQNRKKRAPRPPKGVAKKATRGSEELLASIQQLSSIRATLKADDEDEENINGVFDLEVAIKVLQWVVDPKSTEAIEEVVLGGSDS